MKKQLKAAIAAILAVLMALAVFPVSALTRLEAEKSPVTPYWTVPAGYSSYDYNKMAAFLEQADEYGVKNGQKLNPNYDVNDPETWKLETFWLFDDYYYDDGDYYDDDDEYVLNWSGFWTYFKQSWLTTDPYDEYDDYPKSIAEGVTHITIGIEWGSGRSYWYEDEDEPYYSGTKYINSIVLPPIDRLNEKLCETGEGNPYLEQTNHWYFVGNADFSNMSMLFTFVAQNMYSDNIYSIDFTGCDELSDIYCWNFPIKSLNLPNDSIKSFAHIEFDFVAIKDGLTIPEQTSVFELSCKNMWHTPIEFYCESVDELYLFYNHFDTLDLSNISYIGCLDYYARDYNVYGASWHGEDVYWGLREIEYRGITCRVEGDCGYIIEADYFDEDVWYTGSNYIEVGYNEDEDYFDNLYSFEGWYDENDELITSSRRLNLKSLYGANAEGVFTAKFTRIDTSLPAPETVETAVVDGKPVIEWSEVDGAESYQVWRKTEGGEYELFASVAETSYTDSSAELDTVYSYKICAVDSKGEQGHFSEEVSVEAYLLSAPQNVSISLVDRKPFLTWNEVEHATGYQIWRKPKGASYSYKLIATVSDTSFTDTASLSQLKIYNYRIKAVDNYGGVSAYSSPVSITAYGLGTPEDASAVIVDTKPFVSWSAVENASGYEVYRKVGSSKYKLVATVDGTSFTDDDTLTSFKTYYYKVRAIDDYGTIGSFCTPVSVVAYGVYTPADIGVEMADCKPVVTWSSAENATGYQVWRAPKGGSYELIGTVSGTSFTDEAELTPLKTYYYKVKAFDDYGNESAFSEKVFINAYGLAVPKGVKATLVECKPLIAWNAVEYASGYQVWRMLKGGSYELVATVNGTSYFDGDTLVPQKTYYYKIKAIDEYGNESKFSSAVTITSYSVGTPTGVDVFMLNNKPLIAWEPVTYAVSYQVWRMLEGGEYELAGTVSVTSFTDSSALTPGAIYYYKVLAVDGYGNESAFSSAVSIVIPN